LRSIGRDYWDVIIVDSFSGDETPVIAEGLGATVYQREFNGFAEQLNFAVNSYCNSYDWVFRLDADEVISDELKKYLKSWVCADPQKEGSCKAFEVRRFIKFQGSLVKYGGVAGREVTRVFRVGFAHFENRLMDEHVLVSGSLGLMPGHIIDDNLNSLEWWKEKHKKYSILEAHEYVKTRSNKKNTMSNPQLPSGTAYRYRRFKKVYYHFPIFVRPFLFLAIRLFLQRGVLDRGNALRFHFLQCLWYRLLVDVNIFKLIYLRKIIDEN